MGPFHRSAPGFCVLSTLVVGLSFSAAARADVVIDSLPSEHPTKAVHPAATASAPAPEDVPSAAPESSAAPSPSASSDHQPNDEKPTEAKPDDAAQASQGDAHPSADGPASSTHEVSDALSHDPDIPQVIDRADDQALESAEKTKDPKVFAEVLHRLVAKVREKVIPKLEEKIELKSEATMSRVAETLGAFSFAGVFLLFLPFFYIKKYPGKLGVLFKYSALAAVTFFVAVNLFASVLMVMRVAQHSMATVSNPQIAIVNAALDSLDDNADEMVGYAGSIVEPTLTQLESGDTDEPVPVALIENVGKAVGNAKDLAPTFIRIATSLKDLNWITGYVPALLTISTVLLFLLATRPILQEIIALPARAAQGEADVGRTVLKKVFKRIGLELLVTLCLVGILTVVTMVSGIALSLAVRPAVEALLDYVLDSAVYAQTPGASGTTLLISFGGSILFLVLDIAVVMAASAFFLGKAHKLLQQRFHDGVPLAAHKRFLLWGPLGLCLAFALPTIFAEIAEPLVKGPVSELFLSGNDVGWTGFFLSGPIIFVVGFIALFWAARGFKALGFIRSYPLKPAAPLAHDVLPPPPSPEEEEEWDQRRVSTTNEAISVPPPETPWHAKGGAHPITTVERSEPLLPLVFEGPRPPVSSMPQASAITDGSSTGEAPKESSSGADQAETPFIGPPRLPFRTEQEIVASAMDFDDNAPTAVTSDKNWWQPPSGPGAAKPSSPGAAKLPKIDDAEEPKKN